jgi:hypothetical protein
MRTGDLVTRDGTDLHEVVRLTDDGFSGEFRCLMQPTTGWIVQGGVEHNLSRRYDVVIRAEHRELLARIICAVHDAKIAKERASVQKLLASRKEPGV